MLGSQRGRWESGGLWPAWAWKVHSPGLTSSPVLSRGRPHGPSLPAVPSCLCLLRVAALARPQTPADPAGCGAFSGPVPHSAPQPSAGRPVSTGTAQARRPQMAAASEPLSILFPMGRAAGTPTPQAPARSPESPGWTAGARQRGHLGPCPSAQGLPGSSSGSFTALFSPPRQSRVLGRCGASAPSEGSQAEGWAGRLQARWPCLLPAPPDLSTPAPSWPLGLWGSPWGRPGSGAGLNDLGDSQIHHRGQSDPPCLAN